MDPHLAALSRSIDAAELGRRIRASRLAAGLTQADLAGEDVTAAYVSRIEDGQRRPGLHLLDRMANRMGTTLHQLLTGMTTHEARQLDLAVENAAVALALGHHHEALRGATEAADRLQRFGDAALLAEARRIQAEAQRAIGDLDTAITILIELTAGPVPDMNTLRSLIALGHCHCERDEIAKALAIGELAERMAARLGIDGLTEGLDLAAMRAAAHLRRGDTERAAEISRDALQAAAHSPSKVTQAAAYWTASRAEALSNGPTPAAIDLAKTAHLLIDIDTSRQTAERLSRISGRDGGSGFRDPADSIVNRPRQTGRTR